MEYNLAKVEDIQIGTKIGSLLNGKVCFKGDVCEITFKGVSCVNNAPYIGGYIRWGNGASKMSFSFNEKANNNVVLL